MRLSAFSGTHFAGRYELRYGSRVRRVKWVHAFQSLDEVAVCRSVSKPAAVMINNQARRSPRQVFVLSFGTEEYGGRR